MPSTRWHQTFSGSGPSGPTSWPTWSPWAGGVCREVGHGRAGVKARHDWCVLNRMWPRAGLSVPTCELRCIVNVIFSCGKILVPREAWLSHPLVKASVFLSRHLRNSEWKSPHLPMSGRVAKYNAGDPVRFEFHVGNEYISDKQHQCLWHFYTKIIARCFCYCFLNWAPLNDHRRFFKKKATPEVCNGKVRK